MRTFLASQFLVGSLFLLGVASPAFADAEPAPPQAVRKLPAAAEWTKPPEMRVVTVRLPPVRNAALDQQPSGTVKPLLPPDYKPHNGGPSADKTHAVKTKTAHSAAAAHSKEGGTRKPIPLAPTEADLRKEAALRDGGPATPPPDDRSVGQRLSDKATSIPAQRREWPTTVTNTAGPTSPAGAGSAQDRKGTVIEATGPSQGVIRNRF
ncbi:MAG TPA: hypothetical protein PKE31_21020 [Pseudomonadota bacterium]|nr:hypothetical protein [Pseudomonadota bacterium]